MNRKQKITNRHITDQVYLDQYATAIANRDETAKRISSACLLLHNYLNQREIAALQAELTGKLPGVKQAILERWFDLVEAREAVLKANREVKEAFRECKLPTWPLWYRMKAVDNACKLGLVVYTDWLTNDVVEVVIA